MSGIYKKIYKGNDNIVKVIKDGETVWSKYQILTFKTQHDRHTSADRITIEDDNYIDLRNKTILSVKIGNFQVIRGRDILGLSDRMLILSRNIGYLLDAEGIIPQGTKITIKYI